MPEFYLDDAAKLYLVSAAAFISVCNLFYYIFTVIKGATRPHPYTWMIWGIVTFIVALAQYQNNGGYGCWLTFFVAVNCFINMALGFFKSPEMISRSDRIFLGLCLVAVIIWIVTDNPLWSVILVTGIDTAGFWPTIRKSYGDPFNENRLSFFIYGITYSMGIAALAEYSLITALYPATMVVTAWGLVAFLSVRRYQLRHELRQA